MTDPGSPLFDFLKTMAVLSGILALTWAALRWWLPKLTGIVKGGGTIDIIARQALEPRKTLYVVRVGRATLLIAAAGETVTLLDHVELNPSAEPVPAPGFAEQLKAWREAREQA